MILSKLGEHKPKAIGALITLALVTLLILAGPANALTVSLNNPGTTPFPKGDSISIPGTIDINSNEIVTPSTNLIVTIHGPGSGTNDRVCNFVLHETDLDECDGVTIDLTNNAQNGYGYSYGYGFTNGQISYVLFINTNKFDSGSYTIQTNVNSASSEVQSFEIAAPICKNVLFRSKGYWNNHPQFWAAKLPQTLGSEVVSTTARVDKIFERETKVDKVKAPLLSIRFNLFDHPEAAAYFVPGESITVSALVAQADALLSSANPTTSQLTLMKDRLNKVTGDISSCANPGEQDTTPPVITVPSDITKEATSSSGAKVEFDVSATDEVDGKVDVSCTPKSGSTFPLGTTVVSCTATDDSGNTATATFNVLVSPMCKEIVFRSKGYFDNHPQLWAPLLSQTIGNDVVSTSAQVQKIFDRKTKVDKVKAPLLALKFNLVNFPEAASLLVPGESITIATLADQADTLLKSANPTTAQLTTMQNRLESVSTTLKSCPNNKKDEGD